MIHLPEWLDRYIFCTLGGAYVRQNKDLVVLSWNRTEIQGYLGTYFPRSFAEAYCIFTDYFSSHKEEYCTRSAFSVFDFGCGTGGELIGFIMAVAEQLPSVQTITVRALDGNHHALRFLESIIVQTASSTGIDIRLRVMPVVIADFYDMDIADSIITERYDFIITFKAICEFVTNQQFQEKNPYKHLVEVFLPHLADAGILCLAEITTFSEVSKEWLPAMLDQVSVDSGVRLIERNDGYNEEFFVSHSKKTNDRSKITWRIYTKHDSTI